MGGCYSEPLKVIHIDDAKRQLYIEMREELSRDLKDDLIPYILKLANEMREIVEPVVDGLVPIAEAALETVAVVAINATIDKLT